MGNDIVKQATSTELGVIREAVENEQFLNDLRRAVGDRAGSFAIGIINAVNTNPELLKCETTGLLTAGLTSAQMNLSLSPALGHATILPFSKSFPLKKDAKGKVTEWGKKYSAQLVIQVRGLKNLALRTNQYTYLNDFAVYASQKVTENQVTGVPTVTGPMDTSTKITHYGAYLKLTSGYEHCIIWTVEDVLDWGKKYSPTYDKEKEAFGLKSKWVTDFDGQARKTVMKFLINHHGVISERDRSFVELSDEKPVDEYGQWKKGEDRDEFNNRLDNPVIEGNWIDKPLRPEYPGIGPEEAAYIDACEVMVNVKGVDMKINELDAPHFEYICKSGKPEKKQAAEIINDWREKHPKKTEAQINAELGFDA